MLLQAKWAKGNLSFIILNISKDDLKMSELQKLLKNEMWFYFNVPSWSYICVRTKRWLKSSKTCGVGRERMLKIICHKRLIKVSLEQWVDCVYFKSSFKYSFFQQSFTSLSMIESQHVPAENMRPHQRHFQKLSIGRDHLRPNEGTLGNWLPHVESIHLEVSWEIVVTGKWIFSNEHLSNSNTTTPAISNSEQSKLCVEKLPEVTCCIELFAVSELRVERPVSIWCLWFQHNGSIPHH